MNVYAVADLHGQLNLWKQIQNFLKEDDMVFVLGDCGDRGPHPWETIKEIAADKRAKYIKGNHEDMLAKAMTEWFEADSWDSDDTELLYYNGGEGTYNGWHKDGANKEWIKFLKELPDSACYKNKNGVEILMSHAGFTPGLSVPKNFLWDRTHFNDKWFGKENEITIHGHTPIPHVWKNLGGPKDNMPEDGKAFWYCDKHKVCIDTGACVTNKTVLLNLDTFEEKMFTIRKDNDNE